MNCRILILSISFLLFIAREIKAQLSFTPSSTEDTLFWQEYHEPHPIGKTAGENEVRSITTDEASNIWIATAAGILMKKKGENTWQKMSVGIDQGPAYAVMSDAQSRVWLATWRGVYLFQNNVLKKISGTEGPVAALCCAKEGVYAFGPKGVWFCKEKSFIKKNYLIAHSVRKAVSDMKGGVWVASDVGLFHCMEDRIDHYKNPDVLISAYIKGIAFDNNQQLWAAGLGGVSILQDDKKIKALRPSDGIPSIQVNCVTKSPDSTMWVGTNVGIVRYSPDGAHTLRFSRRWLMDDCVKDIAFDKEGNAWIATEKGVSAIMKKKMTLAQKQAFFYDITMKRHVRKPWIVGQCRLKNPEDVNSWEPEDDDNDGEYGGNYLAMESFRYAVTKNNDAKQKAKKSFEFLKMLEEITGKDGFFARTIVPVSWGNNVHDVNTKYTPEQLADELVKEPRFKPVETRWHRSKDGKWLWKGDTSSDEWCGHMMGYFFYYELVADKPEKEVIAAHVAKLVDHLITHNFNMVDVDGTHTRWSVWSPDKLNREPEWAPDRDQNSMELLTFLKLAYYMTGNAKYQEHYLKLIKEEHYLDNMSRITEQNPAWFIYFDAILQMYLYPILLHCEKDPELLAFYQKHADNWMEKRKADKSPVVNFFYSYARSKKTELTPSVEFLKDTPLDLVNWNIDHSKREDIKIIHEPVLDEWQVSELPPASIRAAVRWDRNPWTAVNGYSPIEREPVFWLLPYWMGRYLKMIE